MASEPSGMGGFFPGMFGDLLKMLNTNAPFPFELAAQLAESIANEGEVAPVDPLDRIRLEELVAIADLQVADVTGMATTSSGQRPRIVPLSRVDWVKANLESWRPTLEKLAAVLRPAPRPADAEAADSTELDDEAGAADLTAMLTQWATAAAPTMIAMQFGSLIGHLATRTLGQYELVLPRSGPEELTVVPENVRAFAEDWSLSLDDVTFYLTVHDVALHAVVTRPHVRARLASLLVEHAKGFQPDPQALESALGDSSLSDAPELAELTRLLGDPSALGAMVETPELARIRNELAALSAAIGGYAEWVTRTVAERSIGSGTPIAEALRRRRVARGQDEKAADALFGLALDQVAVERGDAFVRGVLERGGEADLAKLFVIEANLPTPAEIDAPGLWIERVNLPPLD